MKNFQRNLKYYLLALLFIANLFIWNAIFAEERGELLTVAFLDVGQGDAIFIEAPNGNQMLVDGGKGRAVLKALNDVLPFYDHSIDVVLATHPDEDHIGGLPEVLSRYAVDFFLDSGVSSQTGTYESLVQAIGLAGTERIIARRGMKIIIDEDRGIFLEILFPDRGMEGANANDASIIAKLIYGGTSFLLTGDSPQKIEKYLVMRDGKNLDIDVLKVGHHGSKTSTSQELLGFSSPQIAVISAGKDNRYGHPHEDVLARLREFGIDVLRTDEEGTIILQSDGEEIFVE